jgi:hypothetical protein
MTSCSVVGTGIHGVIFQQIHWYLLCMPISVAARYKAAHLPGLRVRITSGAWTSLLSVVRSRSLHRADDSSKGVLPSVIVKPPE